MRKVMLSIIVMLAVLAGIPATACWYLDPTSPAMTAFSTKPTEIIPPVETEESTVDPETGGEIVTRVVDSGTSKLVTTTLTYTNTSGELVIIEQETRVLYYPAQPPHYDETWIETVGKRITVRDPASGAVLTGSLTATTTRYTKGKPDGDITDNVVY